jgi:hypothetical protein
MKAYFDHNRGSIPEGNSVGALVESVWSRWNKIPKSQSIFDAQGISEVSPTFLEQLEKLNIRRNKYLMSNNYKIFLEEVYDMDASTTYLKNAKDFQILLGNKEFGASMRGMYIDEGGFNFMRRVFSSSGTVQTTLTMFTDLMITQEPDDTVTWLKWYFNVYLKQHTYF